MLTNPSNKVNAQALYDPQLQTTKQTSVKQIDDDTAQQRDVVYSVGVGVSGCRCECKWV